jgi:hypothetical protein
MFVYHSGQSPNSNQERQQRQIPDNQLMDAHHYGFSDDGQ